MGEWDTNVKGRFSLEQLALRLKEMLLPSWIYLSLLFILSQYYNITDSIFESKLIFESFEHFAVTNALQLMLLLFVNFFFDIIFVRFTNEAESIPWTS